MIGIQSIHNQGICHRDIKLENILLDDHFSPKIADFGYAIKNAPNLQDYIGTEKYAPPELWDHLPYDGKMVDIFCLGQTLMYMTFGVPGFEKTDGSCELYQNIFDGNIDIYWEKMKTKIYDNISNDFKRLYIKMISFNPTDRPDSQTILNDNWLKTIREMSQNEFEDLEKRVEAEFKSREEKIKSSVNNEIANANKESKENDEKDIQKIPQTKSCGNQNEEMFFKTEVKPRKVPEGLDYKFCIKINFNVNPTEFMNNLCELIIEEFGNDNCYIEADKYKPKLTVIFGEDEEKENEKIIGNNVTMKIKLYESQNGLILKMSKIEGDKKNFYDKFTAIVNLLKKIYLN